MLARKMLRDLWKNKGTYIACMVVMALGIMIYNMFSISYDNFYTSQMNYYETYHLADGFIELQNMPQSEVKRLEKIPGIKSIEGRLVEDVKYFSETEGKNAYLRLVSYNPINTEGINQFKKLIGSAPLRGNQTVIDQAFYDENNLKIGDKLDILISGKKTVLEVTGTGASPEFIYVLRTDQEIYPDHKTFGIAFVTIETMEKLFDRSNQVNQISFILNDGVSYEDVEDILKTKLNGYGLKRIYPRKDQKSHMLLSNELDGMKSMAKAMPMLFLIVAGMMMSIMLKRMVETQRGQIGVIKAFGATDIEVLLHYMSYAMIVGISAGLVGTFLGNLMVIPFSDMFQTMFNMPIQKADFSVPYFVKGMLIVTSFSCIAGYQGTKGTLKLQPSEAMKAPSPVAGGNAMIERMGFLWKKLGVYTKMALRNIFRNKSRSIFVMTGVVFTFALLGMPWTFKDMLNSMIYDQFEIVQTFDMKITLSQPTELEEALQEILSYDGVEKVEPLLEIPVKLYKDALFKEVMLIGIKENSELYNLYDQANVKQQLSGSGVILSEQLAEKLGVGTGDKIYVESSFLRNSDVKKSIVIEGIIPQFLGINGYMNEQAMIKFLDQKSFVTAIMVNANKSAMNEIKKDYKDSMIVFGLDENSEMMMKYQEMMKMILSMIVMICIFGLITGFAIIYASLMITLSERAKELASMLVMGMSYKEVFYVVTLEQWIVSAVAAVLGIPFMKLMVYGMALEMNNDVYTMSSAITPMAVITAIVMTIFSIWFAQQSMKKKIEAIDLVSALTVRE